MEVSNGTTVQRPSDCGDTNRWDGKLVVGATVIGTAFESAQTSFWKMSNGKPGDTILVTGSLGGSIRGKHLDFEPRIDFSKHLINNYTSTPPQTSVTR